MKKSFWIALVLFFVNTAKGQLPFGDTTVMNIIASPVYPGGFAVDGNGNTYTAFSNSGAILSDTVLDDPAPVRMIKQNAQGDFIWAKQYGVSFGQIGSISTILEKNNYLAMAGYSTINFFDNGSVNGVDFSYTYYVARFNANGDILNAVKMPGRTLISLKEDGTICFVTIVPGSGYLGDEFITDNGAFIFGEIDLNGVISWYTISSFADEQLKTCAYANGKFYVYGAASNNSSLYFNGQYMSSPNGTNYGYLAKMDLASHSLEAYKGVSNTLLPGMDGISAPFLDVDDDGNVYMLAQYYSSNPTAFCFDGTVLPLQPNQAYILKLNDQLNLTSSILVNQASNNTNMRMRQLKVHDNELFMMGSINNVTHLIKYTTNFEEISRMSLVGAENPNEFNNNFILSMYIDDNDQISVFQYQYACSNGFCGNHMITRSKANSNLLQGRAYKDMDQNGSFNAGDVPLNGTIIQVQPTNELIVTDANGYYTLNADTGTYQLSLGTVSPYFTQLPCNWTFSAFNQVQSHDLVLIPQPGGHDLQLDMVSFSQAVVGSTLLQKIIVSNQGTYMENGLVYIIPYSFNGGITAIPSFPYTTMGDTIVYTLNALSPEDTLQLVLQYDVPVGMLSMLGQTDYSNVWIDGPVEDTIQNHTASSWVILVAAYDPNLKESSTAEEIMYTNELSKKVTYTIHFQNEGNFPAENIEVRDQLSNQFDLGTIKILDCSDSMYATIENNEIRFHFDDIFLPYKDSDEEGSKGYVSFTVDLLSGFEIGDQLCNQAAIFFDYNPAIITNNYCIGVIQSTASISELKTENDWSVYPNPFSDQLQLTGISLNQDEKNFMVVSDELGRVVRKIQIQEFIDLGDLKSGTYILTVLSSDNMIIGLHKKVIKVGG